MSINKNRPSQTGNFTPERSLSASRLNKMGQFIDQARPGIHIGNVMPSETAGGTIFNILQARARPAANKHPYKIVKKKNTEIGVLVGTTNSVVSTMGGKALTDDTAKLTITATAYIYLKASGQGTDPSGYYYPSGPTEVIQSPSVMQSTDDIGYIALGRVVVLNNKIKTINQFVKNSLWTERLKCGTSPAEYYWSAV